MEKTNKYIAKAHLIFVKTVLLVLARNYAAKGLPKAKDDSIEPYITVIKGFYTEMKKEVSIRLQGGVQKMMGKVNLATINQKIDLLKPAIKAVSDTLENLLTDRGRLFTTADIDSYKNHLWLLYVFGIGECLWNVAFFLRIGEITIIAASIGVIVGAAQITAVKISVQLIKDIDDIRKQIIRLLMLTLVFLILSFILGAIRYWFAHEGAGADIPFLIMNPGTFVAINMLFICATGLIVYRFFPTKVEMEQVKNILAVEKEIAKVKKELAGLNAQLTGLIDEREFMIDTRTMIFHTEKKMHEKIDSLYDQAVGIFMEENIAKRHDGVFPDCFKNPPNHLPDEGLNNTNLIN